jgi:hypothetical protein
MGPEAILTGGTLRGPHCGFQLFVVKFHKSLPPPKHVLYNRNDGALEGHLRQLPRGSPWFRRDSCRRPGRLPATHHHGCRKAFSIKSVLSHSQVFDGSGRLLRRALK